jgi:predicted GIY-YIG superfamily endonuclease
MIDWKKLERGWIVVCHQPDGKTHEFTGCTEAEARRLAEHLDGLWSGYGYTYTAQQVNADNHEEKEK